MLYGVAFVLFFRILLRGSGVSHSSGPQYGNVEAGPTVVRSRETLRDAQTKDNPESMREDRRIIPEFAPPVKRTSPTCYYAVTYFYVRNTRIE